MDVKTKVGRLNRVDPDWTDLDHILIVNQTLQEKSNVLTDLVNITCSSGNFRMKQFDEQWEQNLKYNKIGILLQVVGVSIYSSFWKNLYSAYLPNFNQNFCFCFFLLLNCMSSLYIMDISLLSDTLFAKLCLYFTDCLFNLLIVSLLCRSCLT